MTAERHLYTAQHGQRKEKFLELAEKAGRRGKYPVGVGGGLTLLSSHAILLSEPLVIQTQFPMRI